MEDIQAQVNNSRAKTKSRKRSWKLKAAFILLKGIAMLSLIVAGSFFIHAQSIRVAEYATTKADQIYVSAIESLPKSLIPKESNIAARLPLSLADAIKRVAREQRVPEVALSAMVEQESSNGEFLTSQLEVATYRRLLKSMPNTPEEQIQELAKSHGPAHVMGITALEFCDLQVAELYDNYKSLTCAAKYLRMQIDKTKGPSIEDRLWQAFRGYNGQGPAAGKHADRVYALMKKKMNGSLTKELS